MTAPPSSASPRARDPDDDGAAGALAERWRAANALCVRQTEEEAAARTELEAAHVQMYALTSRYNAASRRLDSVYVAMGRRVAAHFIKAADPNQLHALECFNQATQTAIADIHSELQETHTKTAACSAATGNLELTLESLLAYAACDDTDFDHIRFIRMVADLPGGPKHMVQVLRDCERRAGAR